MGSFWSGAVMLILIIIAILWLILAFFFPKAFYRTLPVAVNSFINFLKPIDKSCSVDDDCIMAQTDCEPCICTADLKGSKADSVNKNYKPLCPIKSKMVFCPACAPPWTEYKPYCKGGMCSYTV
jgi:hypothetical protein